MRIASLALLALASFLNLSAKAQTQPLTAQQVIERIQKNVGVPWFTPTVDTFKAGDPNTPVTGIAVTMMATFDVIQRAAAAGKNLVITHEPTFYSHQDQTAMLEKHNDAVYAEKAAFIRDHHMVVFRFHDHWHRRNPDGIQHGMMDALGWQAFVNPTDPRLFTLPETTLADLASSIKHKLDIVAMRVVGDPQLKLTKVGMMPGAGGSPRQIQMLERDDVEALVIGEVPEWETVEYVADAVTEHKHKALLMLTHIPSEQAGMDECTTWLKTFISEVPIEFIPARQPFWLPK
jgi:putative NIF3 family GTP cyclohydrolase 1 type 2